jgi:hypothetical protein
VSVEPAEEGRSSSVGSRAIARRIVRTFLSSLSDSSSHRSEVKLIRALAPKNQGHWAGTIVAPITYVVDAGGTVKWVYISASAADRPSRSLSPRPQFR